MDGRSKAHFLCFPRSTDSQGSDIPRFFSSIEDGALLKRHISDSRDALLHSKLETPGRRATQEASMIISANDIGFHRHVLKPVAFDLAVPFLRGS